MLVELVERLGHTFDWWLEQPLAFHRIVYGHLQEIDRRRDWIDRDRAIDRAWLMARAFHDTASLNDESQRHIATAGPHYDDDVALARAAAMYAELERGRVLEGLTYGH